MDHDDNTDISSYSNNTIGGGGVVVVVVVVTIKSLVMVSVVLVIILTPLHLWPNPKTVAMCSGAPACLPAGRGLHERHLRCSGRLHHPAASCRQASHALPHQPQG